MDSVVSFWDDGNVLKLIVKKKKKVGCSNGWTSLWIYKPRNCIL